MSVDINEYSKMLDDLNDESGINPQAYADIVIRQILKAPHIAFANGSVEAGLHSNIVGVQQLQVVCRAWDKLTKDDKDLKAIDDEEATLRKKDSKPNLIELSRLSNKRLEILLTKVFATSYQDTTFNTNDTDMEDLEG